MRLRVFKGAYDTLPRAILRAQLDTPDELQILCGLAVGYADPAFPANQLRTPRNPVGENVVFLDS